MPAPGDQPRWPDTIPWQRRGPGPGRWRSRGDATSWTDLLFERITGVPAWADRAAVRRLALMRPIGQPHQYTEGAVAQTHRLRYPDGSQAVRKTFADQTRPKAEYLASLVAEAVGVVAPAVVKDPTDPEHSVIMGFIPGELGTVHTGSSSVAQMEEALLYLSETDAGHRIGLMDILIGNPDRHSENWMLSNELDTPHPWPYMANSEPLRRPIPIDNSEAFDPLWGGVAIQDPGGGRRFYVIPFVPGAYLGFARPWAMQVRGPEAAIYMARGTHAGAQVDSEGARVWTYRPDNPLHPDDVPALRRRLAALQPVFEAEGMSQAYRDMGMRFEALAAHAGGTERMFPDE